MKPKRQDVIFDVDATDTPTVAFETAEDGMVYDADAIDQYHKEMVLPVLRDALVGVWPAGSKKGELLGQRIADLIAELEDCKDG